MSAPQVSVNVASYLPIMAERSPDKKAIVCAAGRSAGGRARYESLTFGELNEKTDRYAAGLLRIGIDRGTRTVLMVRPGLEFFPLTFALFKIGAVIVMVDPGMGRRNLAQCLAEAEPEAFVGIPIAHAARKLFRWARATVRINVTVGRRWFWGGHRHVDLLGGGEPPPEMSPSEENETAAILFTSGSTGVPKGAVYTHGVFAAQVEFLRDQFQFGEDEIDLATFPLFALFDPALGVTAVIPEMDASKPAKADPRKLAEAIEDQGCTQMFGSPALVENLARHGHAAGLRFPTLKRVLSAGAPVRPHVLESFAKLLAPDARLFTPYGATEALPVSSIESREIIGETGLLTGQGRGNCVGLPVPKVEVAIVRITDEAIETWSDDLLMPQGEIGEIVVRGPVVTESYFNRPEQTRLAKIRSADGRTVYHRMGDVGYLDDRGRLWFCGRKSHRVRTPDAVMFTIPCEGIFNTHPDVFRTALVGVGPSADPRPVLCVELEKGRGAIDRSKVERDLLELADTHDHTRRIKSILFHDRFPVDPRHNAKIVREELAAWAGEQLA